MKKILIIIICLFVFTGCVNINNLKYKEIVDEVLKSNIDLTNQYRTGYKYYLPRNLGIEDNKEYNEKFSDANYNYYLYLDIVSYNSKVIEEYIPNRNLYYSDSIYYNNKYGYLEINKENDKYLVEMVYNYAKIEVIVEERDIKETIYTLTSILSSINYNEKIISNLIDKNVLEFKETEINIFETKKGESNTLKYYEEYGTYEETPKESLVPDTDIIK